MTTYLGKSCSFGLPRVPFVNCRQFMYLVISLLVLRAGCGIWLYQFLIIAYLFTSQPTHNLVLANTLGNHKPSGRWTWHSPDGTHHNQIDYILVKKRFRSGIKTARTRTFPGADVGSNHEMVMMTFQTRLNIQGNQPSQESGLTSRSWMIQQ